MLRQLRHGEGVTGTTMRTFVTLLGLPARLAGMDRGGQHLRTPRRVEAWGGGRGAGISDDDAEAFVAELRKVLVIYL